MLKLIGVALFASMAVAVGAGSATASGGWDDAGSSSFKYRDTSLHLWFTGYVKSTGGNFRACVDPTDRAHEYALWEHDTSVSKKVSSSRSSSGGCLTFKSIGDYVDGDNNRAEFFLSTTDPEGGGGVVFFD